MRKLTLTALVAALTTLGGLVAVSVDWALKTQERLGISGAVQDSLFRADSLIRLDVKRLEKTAGIKSRKGSLPRTTKQEGLARRLWHLVF